MAVAVAVQIEVADILGTTLLRVNSSETVQMPGLAATEAHGALLAQVIERVVEENRDKAIEQAKQLFEAGA